MNEEKNEPLKEIKQNNNGLVIAIVIILLISLVGFGAYAWYMEASEEDVLGDFSCSSCSEKISSTPLPTSNVKSLYNNSRFGFVVMPPNDFSSFESENGDGVTYTNTNGVTIRVFATNNYEGLDVNTYLDNETKRLMTDTGNAKEVSINEVDLGGCEGERRSWEYTSSIDGVETIMERAMCLSDDVFYIVDFESPKDVYDQYSSMFDEIIFSYKLK